MSNKYIIFLKKILSLIYNEKKLAIIFIVISIFAALTEGIGISMLAPILETQSNQSVLSDVPILKEVSQFIDDDDKIAKIQRISIALAIIFCFRGVLVYCVEALAGIIPFKIQQALYQEGYDKLLGVEWDYFSEKGIGDHLNAITDWGARVTQLITSVLVLFVNLTLFIIYFSMMLLISVKMAIAATIFVLTFSFILKRFISRPMHFCGEQLSHKNASLANVTHETMTGMRFIKLSSAEGLMSDRYEESLTGKIKLNIKLVLLQSITNPFLATTSGLFICSLIFSVTFVEEQTEPWLATLLLFLFLLSRLLSPVSQLNIARNHIITHMFALDKFDDFFKETHQRRQPTGDKPFQGVNELIAFNDVTFKYARKNQNIIQNLDLTIKAGEMVAIVGPSGSGKSTLVSLLSRFFEPDQGSIEIDGTPLDEFDISDLRRKIGVVSQDVFIFNDTVTNNISFGTENITQADIEIAAKFAAADEFISELPEGYDTYLGDQGSFLSGGQRQRISFARAVLRNPSLLILDEATSSLDTYTEKSIQNAVESLRGKRTILVIAHRLSTIQKADKVVVLKNGSVVEVGTHKELVALQGVYWDMVNHQQLDLVD